jgi:hypothetical protein
MVAVKFWNLLNQLSITTHYTKSSEMTDNQWLSFPVSVKVWVFIF